MSGVDPRASSAFTAAAEAYERGRPSWPLDGIERLAREFGLDTGSRVVDLAAGTGKLSRLLPGHVVAVEPLDAMRAAIPEGIEAVTGTAEAIPLDDASVDAVFVAEAFHWFDRAKAIEEIARVLRPGGGLAILWNRPEWSPERNPWLERFGKLAQPHLEASGGFPLAGVEWTEEIDALGLFDPIAEDHEPHVQVVGADGFLSLVGSWSHIANLPEADRAAFLDQVRELIGDQREIELDYRTQIFKARRRGDA